MISDNKNNNSPKPEKYGQRHFLVFICFCCNAINFAQKVNLSVGIVAMMDNTHNPVFTQFDWNEITRGLVLSSLFWGYTIAPIPAGFVGQNFGVKIPLFGSMLIGSTLTVLLPFIALLGWEYICAARFICGLMQGSSYPLIQVILSKWLHPDERGYLASLTLAGSKFGMTIMLAIGGIIASSIIGWPGIFFVSGGIGYIFCGLWWFYISDLPADSRHISKEELNYLNTMTDVSEKKVSPPWRKILTSIPFLSTFVAQSTGSWGFYLLLNEIPTYINGVFHFNINANGFLSSMPYLTMFCLSLVFSVASNFLTSHHYISNGIARKLFNSIGMWGAATLLLILAYSWENKVLSMILLIAAVGTNCGINAGYLINYLDLAPNYVGFLIGIGTFGGNLMSILGPIFVGCVVTDTTDPHLWKYVFLVTSGIYLFGNAVFVCFGSGETQPWNEQISEEKAADCESQEKAVSDIQVIELKTYLETKAVQ